MKNEDQGEKLIGIKKIGEHTVIAELHRILNSVTGTVYSETTSQCTEEENLE